MASQRQEYGKQILEFTFMTSLLWAAAVSITAALKKWLRLFLLIDK